MNSFFISFHALRSMMFTIQNIRTGTPGFPSRAQNFYFTVAIAPLKWRLKSAWRCFEAYRCFVLSVQTWRRLLMFFVVFSARFLFVSSWSTLCFGFSKQEQPVIRDAARNDRSYVNTANCLQWQFGAIVRCATRWGLTSVLDCDDIMMLLFISAAMSSEIIFREPLKL